MEAVTLVLEPTGTTSVMAPAGSEYTCAAAWPRAGPPLASDSWLAIAHSPENMGQATLVPPHTCHTSSGTWPGTEMAMTAPVKGSASQEISGSRRFLPGSDFWYAGLENALGPPPEPKMKPKSP